MKTKQLTPPKETVKQRGAFLLYFNMGEGRSLVNVQRELRKKGIKISQTSLAHWSKKYRWVERVNAMDDEVQTKTEEIAIREATVKKSDILKAVKNTMIKYNHAILAGEIVPNAHDFHRMWEIQRRELGLDTNEEIKIKFQVTDEQYIELTKRIARQVSDAGSGQT